MERRQIEISAFCEKELEQECSYYEEHYSARYAQKFWHDFYAKVNTISTNPYIYPECRFLPTKKQVYRNIIWGNYLIVYKILSSRVRVLTLFHTKQTPSKVKRARKR